MEYYKEWSTIFFTRKVVIFIFFVTIYSSCSTETTTPLRPNIIYVLADDLGYGDLSCFNPQSKIRTVHIDKMASSGMRMTDMHSSSSVCTPTRYGILTGRYNWRSPIKQGVLWGKSKALIPNNRTTITSLLKKQGYTTAFVG